MPGAREMTSDDWGHEFDRMMTAHFGAVQPRLGAGPSVHNIHLGIHPLTLYCTPATLTHEMRLDTLNSTV